MSTEVNYIRNVCVMGEKLLLNLSANLHAALIYNSLMESARKQSISSRHKFE